MRSPMTRTLSWTAALLAIGTAGTLLAEGLSAEAPASPSPAQLPFELPSLPAEDAGFTPNPATAVPLAAASKPPPAPSGGGAAQGGPAAIGEDIRDIRGPIPMAPSRRWGWITTAGVVGSVLLAFLWRRYRRRNLVRARRAYEIAFDQLERAKSLMNPDQAREFSFLVSEAVRSYIDQRYAVGITRCTTQEFLASLDAGPSNPLQEHRGRLCDFLRHCDLAKFARWSLSIEQMGAMHESAWRFVEDTRPRPEESEKATPAATRRNHRMQESVPALAPAGGTS